MNETEPYAFSPLSRAFIVLLAFMFSVASLLPCSYIPLLKQAMADDSSVQMTKAGNIHYPSGSWNTHKFTINDGRGDTVGYCVEPAKNSPSQGTYSKLDFVAASGRTAELKADLWFSYGGPGFDASMWPSTNWNGDPMSEDDYYLASHILLSDVFSSDLFHATFGIDDDFREWLTWNLLGYSYKTTGLFNDYAVGRQAANRVGEVPQNYETFLIGGGSHQLVACAGYFEPNGNLKMMKHSSMPEVTDGNPCYTLQGIQYGLYTQEDCAPESDTGYRLEVDESGYAELLDIPAAAYFIREIESSLEGTGYAYDPTVYTCTVEPGETSWVHNTANELGDVDGNDLCDAPQGKNIDVLVRKHDALTLSSTPSGYEPMENAMFMVRYFDNMAFDYTVAPTREWIFRTDEEGMIDLANGLTTSFVSGDALYKHPETDEVYFPLGTYVIEEMSPCPGYQLATEGCSSIFVLNSAGSGEQDVSSDGILKDDGIIVTEPPTRHDMQFSKKDDDTQAPLANIPFLIQRMDGDNEEVIEEHVAVTNANGIFNSEASNNAHTYRTNCNDGLVTLNPDGSYSVDEDELDADAGIWFGVAQNGSWVEPNDDYGAFPDNIDARYIVTELPVSANEGKELVCFEARTHATRPSTIQLGTVENITPTFATVLRDDLDGDKILSRDYDAHLVDTISYSGLIAGRTYRIEGYLGNGNNGLTIKDTNGETVTSQIEFTPTSSSGTVEMDFYFDAHDIPAHTRIVACEVVYERFRELARHDDLLDRAQTVTVIEPQLQTNAYDWEDGDKQVIADVDATIFDHVMYSGLTPGQHYVMHGILMDKATQEPFVFDGQQVEASFEFDADASSGEIDMEYTFNATELKPGSELVVFEELTHHDDVIAEHKDIDDAGQTVTVVPPNLSTTAYDPDNGDKIVATDQNTKIVDRVGYAGLKRRTDYTLRASLMNKQTGRPVLDSFGRAVTAEQTITTTRKTSGTAEIVLEFDALDIQDGEAAVIFEELYRDGYLLATHIDLYDADQSIIFKNPLIRTYASALDNTKKLIRDERSTVQDIVSYQNLISGNTYTLEGSVYEKASGKPVCNADGEPVSASTEFTAENPEGFATLNIEFDATDRKEGDELVVYERLLREGVLLASHEDLDDDAQMVVIGQQEIKTQASSGAGTKEIMRDALAKITDTVSYKNLVAGCEYEMRGTVMDKATSSPLVDAKGDAVSKAVAFVPERSEGSLDLDFEFDASNLEAGSELVVFEKLLCNGKELASHEDIDDGAQTIYVRGANIATKASDAEDGDQVIGASSNAQILDVVTYEGLLPGEEYELVGTLMDKESGEPITNEQGGPVQSRRTFTAQGSFGTVEVMFSYDASETDHADQIVVFEGLYHNGSLIAEHADISSASQTITVAGPEISTYAKGTDDDDEKTLSAGTKATIIDTVDYKGLVPGEKYELEGTLMIDNGTLEGIPAHDAFGVPITSHLEFVPETPDGSVDMSFEIDTVLYPDETHVVVFEKLKYGDSVQATHEDIRSETQMVVIPETGTKGFTLIDMPITSNTTTPAAQKYATGAVDTGDGSLLPFAICSALSMLAIIGLIWLRFRIVPNERPRD